MTETRKPTDLDFFYAQLQAIADAAEFLQFELGMPLLIDVEDGNVNVRSRSMAGFYNTSETTAWENLLRTRGARIDGLPPLDPDLMEKYISGAWSNLRDLSGVIGDGSHDRLITIQSLRALLKRGEIELAREFLAVLKKVEHSQMTRTINALLHVAAVRENYSPGRRDLVKSILRLIEYGFVNYNQTIGLVVVPMAIVFLAVSPLDYRLEQDLAQFLDDLFKTGANLSPVNIPPDAEDIAFDFLNYILHHRSPHLSLAGHFLYRMKMRVEDDINRNQLTLMRLVLREDMLRETGRFDEEKLRKYVGLLFDPDPKVKKLINAADISLDGPNEELFEEYARIVRARGGGTPTGTPPISAGSPPVSSTPTGDQAASMAVASGIDYVSSLEYSYEPITAADDYIIEVADDGDDQIYAEWDEESEEVWDLDDQEAAADDFEISELTAIGAAELFEIPVGI